MLPEDLIIYVYKFLSPYALRQLSCSSRLFYQLAWHEICCRYKRLVNSNLSILPALLDRQSYWSLVGQTCYECTVRSTYLIPHPLEPWLLCDVCISKLATDRVLLTLSQVETLYGLVSDGLVADIHSGRMRRCDLAYKKSPSRHSVCNFSMAAVLTSDTSESSDSDTSESSSESDFSNGHSRFFQNPPVKLPMYSIAAQSSVNSDLESRNNSFTLVFYYQHIEQRAREVYGTSDTNKLASRPERDLTRKRQIFLEMEQKKRHKFMYSILNTWQIKPLDNLELLWTGKILAFLPDTLTAAKSITTPLLIEESRHALMKAQLQKLIHDRWTRKHPFGWCDQQRITWIQPRCIASNIANNNTQVCNSSIENVLLLAKRLWNMQFASSFAKNVFDTINILLFRFTRPSASASTKSNFKSTTVPDKQALEPIWGCGETRQELLEYMAQLQHNITNKLLTFMEDDIKAIVKHWYQRQDSKAIASNLDRRRKTGKRRGRQ